MSNKIVVTRHRALVDWLIDNGHIDSDTPHIARASTDGSDIKGKHVYGILPNWLACHTKKFTELQLNLPAEKRNNELTYEDIEFYLVKPRTYVIREVKE